MSAPLRAMVLGVLPFSGRGAVHVLAVTVAAGLLTVVVLAVGLTARRRPRRRDRRGGGRAAGDGLRADAGGRRPRPRLVERGRRRCSTSTRCPTDAVVRDRVEQSGLVSRSAQRVRLMIYEFYRPANTFYIDGETPPGESTPFVIAPLDDDELRDGDARLLWADRKAAIGLWLEPAGLTGTASAEGVGEALAVGRRTTPGAGRTSPSRRVAATICRNASLPSSRRRCRNCPPRSTPSASGVEELAAIGRQPVGVGDDPQPAERVERRRAAEQHGVVVGVHRHVHPGERGEVVDRVGPAPRSRSRAGRRRPGRGRRGSRGTRRCGRSRRRRPGSAISSLHVASGGGT